MVSVKSIVKVMLVAVVLLMSADASAEGARRSARDNTTQVRRVDRPDQSALEIVVLWVKALKRYAMAAN